MRFGHWSKVGAWLLAGTLVAANAHAARLKDIASIQGIQSAQLVGYGLVVGLSRTGDQTTNVHFTRQAIENLMRNMGVQMDNSRGQLRVGNVASVMVTADIPAFAKAGGKADTLVSSLGDATSLQGGTLLPTPLVDALGNVVATASGPVTVGGFFVEAQGDRTTKNHVTAGRIPNGATIEVDSAGKGPFAPANAAAAAAPSQTLTLGLQNPDFTTASRVADAVNAALGANTATALDAASIQVAIPQGNAAGLVQFIASLENLDVTPDNRAKVVIDERTGTVVMGENVRISTVAVAHENLNVQVFQKTTVSQPSPFGTGETIVVPDAEITVTDANASLLNAGSAVQVLPSSISLNELVQALNAMGVTPRDLISILQAIKQAGALQAELVIM